MTKSRLLVAIASAIPLLACTPSVVRTYSYGSSDTSQYECKNGRPCEISVIDAFTTDGQHWTGQLDRDPVYLASDDQDVDIVWKLPPDSDFGFCKQGEDGAFLKSENDGQFSDMSAIGTASGPGGQCKDKYHWKAKNTKRGRAYQYALVFRDSQHIYVIDPWIVNGN